MTQPIFKGLVSASKARTLARLVCIRTICFSFHTQTFAADVHKFKKCWIKTAFLSAGAYTAVDLSYQWLQLLY